MNETEIYADGAEYGYHKGFSDGSRKGQVEGMDFGEILGRYNQAKFTLNELDKLIDYYTEIENDFEAGFRQGLYRAKLWAEEELKKRKEKLDGELD